MGESIQMQNLEIQDKPQNELPVLPVDVTVPPSEFRLDAPAMPLAAPVAPNRKSWDGARVKKYIVRGMIFVGLYFYADMVAKQGCEPCADAAIPQSEVQDRAISSHDSNLPGKLVKGVANVGILASNAVSYPLRIYLFRGGPFSGGGDHRTHLHYFSYLKNN